MADAISISSSSPSSDDGTKGKDFSLSSSSRSGRGDKSHETQTSIGDTLAVHARRENRIIVWSKALVILVIIIATTVVAIAGYRFTNKVEVDNFETLVSIYKKACFRETNNYCV